MWISCCPKRKMFIFTLDFDHLNMAVCLHSLKVHKYVFLRSVNALNKSAFGFHLLRITL